MQDRTQLSSPFPRGPRPLPRRKPKSASPTSADIRRCSNWRTRGQAAPARGGLVRSVYHVSKKAGPLHVWLHQKRDADLPRGISWALDCRACYWRAVVFSAGGDGGRNRAELPHARPLSGCREVTSQTHTLRRVSKRL